MVPSHPRRWPSQTAGIFQLIHVAMSQRDSQKGKFVLGSNKGDHVEAYDEGRESEPSISWVWWVHVRRLISSPRYSGSPLSLSSFPDPPLPLTPTFPVPGLWCMGRLIYGLTAEIVHFLNRRLLHDVFCGRLLLALTHALK